MTSSIRFFLIAAAVILLTVSHLAAQQPTVSNATAQQREGTREGSHPSGFSGDCSSGTIAAGGRQDVTATFAPTLTLSYEGNITVNSDASNGTNTRAASGIEIASAGIWGTAERHGEWLTLPWFGWFTNPSTEWIFHAEHGWWNCVGDSPDSIYVFDRVLDMWGWTSESAYPSIYWFGYVNSWSYYLTGGQAGSRWFYRADAGEWREETKLQDTKLVRIEGGNLPASSQIGAVAVSTFYIGKYEVTWSEWQEVRTYAAANGYDIGSVGAGCADDHPVRSVNWYDVVKWCNAKSEMEGLTAVYTVSGAVYRTGQSDDVVVDAAANGYRLPQEAEWEFAARGGNQTNGYTYSGSNDLNAVGWYWDNASGSACDLYEGRGTWPVGQKAANELGLYDMSGNVWEWCWEWYPGYDGSYRVLRGGSWDRFASRCTVSSRNSDRPTSRYYRFGFRLARSSGETTRTIALSGDQSFGSVTVGQTATRTLTISNSGNSTLTVSGVSYPSGFSGNWSSGTIAAGGSQNVTVTFAPTASQSYSGNVAVNSDATSGMNTRAISGTGTSGGGVTPGMVLVAGGTLPGGSELAGTVVSSFYIGKYEVTWGEWQEVRTYAAANGYDIGSVGAGCADDHPVHSVSWYDVVKWSNAKSEKEGLTAVYTVSGAVYRTGQSNDVVVDAAANGYRLPQEAEWEFAARGGNQTNGYTYSGSNDLNAVGWYWDNASGSACDLYEVYEGRGTWPVGQKAANELGLYDMSGNVWEWCWEWYPGYEGTYRVLRGGSWDGAAFICTVSFRYFNDPANRGEGPGFRLARSAG